MTFFPNEKEDNSAMKKTSQDDQTRSKEILEQLGVTDIENKINNTLR